jgi:hypothetical protein
MVRHTSTVLAVTLMPLNCESFGRLTATARPAHRKYTVYFGIFFKVTFLKFYFTSFREAVGVGFHDGHRHQRLFWLLCADFPALVHQCIGPIVAGLLALRPDQHDCSPHFVCTRRSTSPVGGGHGVSVPYHCADDKSHRQRSQESACSHDALTF